MSSNDVETFFQYGQLDVISNIGSVALSVEEDGCEPDVSYDVPSDSILDRG
jgi:hypothetical protein